MTQAKLPRRDIIAYGFLAVPLAFASMPLYIYAPDFYATQYGLSLSTLAALLLGLRLIDAIQDPFIGYLSDKYLHRRIYIIALAALVLVVAFTALFQPAANFGLSVWFVLFMLLSTSAYSVLSINLNTIGGMWSQERTEKTRIAGYREAFGLIGLLLAVTLPGVLQQVMPSSRAFLWVSMLLGFLMLVALALFVRWYRGEDAVRASSHAPKPLSAKAFPLQTRYTYIVYALSMLASSIPAVLVLFFIRDRLNMEAYTALFLALYFLSGACGMPLWTSISKKTDKATAWLIGMALAVVSFFWAIFITPETAWSYGFICVLSGLALGADLAIPPSILADQIHDQRSEQHAASYYGILTFIAKSALAIASLIALPLLDFFGFKPGGANNADALLVLSITYAGIPSIIKLVSAILLWRMKPLIQNGAQRVQDRNNISDRSHFYSGSNHNV